MPTPSNHTLTHLTAAEISQLVGRPLHHMMPPLVHYAGNPQVLGRPLVALVGSRHPTHYGREQAFFFAKELAGQGITVLSGGAIGIDSIVNSVALGKGGGSCAVLGSGLSQLYPTSNMLLFEKLKSEPDGLLLSPFLHNAKPQKWTFPKRNHVIALLADFVMVIEATLTSGSLITAHAALDYGVDVGALPGPVDAVNSAGTNALIQKGAYCIQKPQDVMERLGQVYPYRRCQSPAFS